MENPEEPFPEVVEWLREQGYQDKQIARIVTQLHERDVDIMVEVIMESIESGELDLDEMAREALGDEGM